MAGGSSLLSPRELFRWTSCALIAPWRLDRLEALEGRPTGVFAALNVALASLVAAVLSTWTYLIGKGLLLGLGEMDLGHDDLPPDSPGQVAFGFVLAVVLWCALFAALPALCGGVARLLYGSDRTLTRRARDQARLLTVWLPVAALVSLAANGALQGELRHPAAAIRARAQMRLDHPDDLRHLNARTRFLSIGLAFCALWVLGLRSPAPVGGRRPVFTAAASVTCALALFAAWRVLPWTFLDAWTG